MKAIIIANPISGRHRGQAAARQAEACFQAAGWQVSSLFTTCPGEARHLAAEAVAERPDIVFACGGDGTISQVVSGLMGSGIPTGIIPAGTGNDLCRTLGLPVSPAEAAHLALHGHAIDIDLLDVNSGAYQSINITSLGFDAVVAERMNKRMRLFGGTFAYLSAVFLEVVHMKPTSIKLNIDGQTWEGDALLVAVANAQCYGGGMKVAPQARVDDGLLDVVLVKSVGRFEFLRNLPRVFAGTHLAHHSVCAWKGAHVRIETLSASPVLIDGDICGQTPIDVRVLPGAAKLWVHADCKLGA
ncbi:MAG: diacylglycerol/lipid kinase family protein [Armatimonadota bacterium]